MEGKTSRFLRENLLGLSLTLIGVLCLVLSVILYMDSRSSRFALAEGGGLGGPEIEALVSQNRAFERIAEAVTPAVVNIRTTQVIKVQQSPFFMDPFFRQFFGDVFGQQFGIPREYREHSLGSGVVLSTDGYIVTNNHVISKATEIEAMLVDRQVFKARLVGADPRTDVAVLKIEAKDLPPISWGDSSELRVGATVMAFGNPFGLNFTVTRGIVSAVGRSGLGIEKYEDFIQTDAPINPGNSGGALVNVRGQVVGINTAILSASQGQDGGGGWNGVGFAIPSNLAKHVMESLIKTGRVTRGYSGAGVRPLNPALARQFKVPDLSGALIEHIDPGSPAEKAGLKQGDVLRKFNGRVLADATQFESLVASTPPGTEITFGLFRDGQEINIKVTLGELPAGMAGTGTAPSNSALRGVTVQELTAAIRDQLGLRPDTPGVVISDLDSDSPAARVGLQPGDVIQSINRQRVETVEDFDRLAADASGETLLRVNRQGSGGFVVVSP
jgi:serine protease Do